MTPATLEPNAVEPVFKVDPATHWLGYALERCPGALRWLGDLETRALREHLGAIDRPVYVAGLARGGSTLLLELLSWQPGVVTHQYRDFPLLHVPHLWNRFLDLSGTRRGAAEERAHGDGVVVDRDSPEAFEEVLWMSFFDHLHDASRSQVLDEHTRHPTFERFYADHIRKLLWLRGGTRYVSKGNYNVTRLAYLLRMFPDARLVVPVRDPVEHVASLMRQHTRFCTGQREAPRARAHLRRAGHFEFGEDRTVIHTGDDTAVAAIRRCRAQGREVEGWARQWSLVYDYVADQMEDNPALAAATLLLPFEELCRDPVPATAALLTHCGFDMNPAMLKRVADHVRPPPAHEPLSDEDRRLVVELTRRTAARLAAFDVGAVTTAWVG